MKKAPTNGPDDAESDVGDGEDLVVLRRPAADSDWSPSEHTETGPNVGSVTDPGYLAQDAPADAAETPGAPEPRADGPDGGDWFADFSDERLLAVLADPTYVGMGRFPPRLSEDQWLMGALQAMDRVGPEVFLRALLAHLHAAYPAFPLKAPSN